MTDDTSMHEAREVVAPASNSYRKYLLAVLLLILAMNYVDRMAISLLLQEVKVDLQLSDTQLGLLTGIAFAFFFAVMGIPIGRWADRGNRVTIISLTTAIFSAAVALCGAATSFVQLLLIRVLAAVGEAGCQPTGLSLISDFFSRADRPRAIARYMLGSPIAFILGFFLTGWLNELLGWRLTFGAIAIPGFLLALLALLTLREPRRGTVALAAHVKSRPAFGATVKALLANAAYRNLLLGMSIQSFFVTGVVLWQPSFFIRTHGLDTGELGTWIAIVYGLTGIAGTWAGGEAASRWARGNERRQLATIAVLFVALAFIKPWVYLVANYHAAFILLGVVSFFAGMSNGPIYAASQTSVPAPMRATSTAILLLFSNLIGSGLGPLAIGALSDAFNSHHGTDALRYALALFSPGYLWAALHLWLAGRHFENENPAAAGVPTTS